MNEWNNRIVRTKRHSIEDRPMHKARSGFLRYGAIIPWNKERFRRLIDIVVLHPLLCTYFSCVLMVMLAWESVEIGVWSIKLEIVRTSLTYIYILYLFVCLPMRATTTLFFAWPILLNKLCRSQKPYIELFIVWARLCVRVCMCLSVFRLARTKINWRNIRTNAHQFIYSFTFYPYAI